MSELRVLSFWLKTNGFLKAAQAIDEIVESDEAAKQIEYDEPWHEEVVKEIGSEPISEEKYYKDNFFKENELADLHEAIMEKEDFTHYTGGEEGGSYLASGALGSVYRGIYDNKPAVIKITVNPINATQPPEKDVENWQAILKAKDSMPPEQAKHIPKIYKLNKSSIFDKYLGDHGGDMTYSVVVMEELFPLTNEMRKVFRVMGQEDKQLARMFKDEDYLYKMAKHIIEELPKVHGPQLDKLLKEISPEDILKRLIMMSNTGARAISRELATYISQSNRALGREIYDQMPNYEKEKYQDLIEMLYAKIFNIIKPFTQPFKMPYNRSDMYADKSDPYNPGGKEYCYSDFWLDTPEIGGFYKTLLSLYEDFDISWGDVHEENIMMDKDGNLKIIDVGRYQVG